MKKSLSFAEAIAYMTANIGENIKSPSGRLFRYTLYGFQSPFNDKWSEINQFTLADINGQWTIPEGKEDLPEITVNVYQGVTYGELVFVEQESSRNKDYESDPLYTKCKIKFNQGEE